MKRVVRVLVAASLLLAVALPSRARAQSSEEVTTEDDDSEAKAQNRALAEALFREGKALGEAGEIAQACKKFKESQRLDPSLGTLLHLAACYAEEGRTASAWAAFNAAADMAATAKQKERETLARTRAAELESKLSQLKLSVAEPVEGLTIELDGTALGEDTIGTPLPVDPGKHRLVASAPGKAPSTQEVEIAEGPSTQEVELPKLADLPAVAQAAPAPALTPVTEQEPSDKPVQRVTGFAIGGAGVVLLGVGGYFGLRAKSQADEADEFCQAATCTQRGLDGHEDAHTSATLSNVFFAVGIAGIAAGTYLVLTSGSPSAPPQSAWWVKAGPARISAGGSF